jgi:outer membrane protein assembly complex protein YaeT
MLTALPQHAGAQARDDPEQLEVSSVSFEGVNSVDVEELQSVLATRESPWLPWADRRYFDPEAFEVDLRRVVAYYRDRGFPDATVVSHDVAVNEDDRSVAVTIRVEEGEPVIVDEVIVEGVDVLTPNQAERLRGRLAVSPGDVAAQGPILEGVQQTADALKNQGFAYAEVRLVREDVAPNRITVRYQAEPGPRAVFGEIEVSGNASVSDAIVRRHLAYRPGDLFRNDAVRESQQQLYGLELFQFATIEPVETGQPVDVPTRVTIAEGDHRRLQFSLGWGTEEKARGEASWRHVNFYGGARTLAARGRWSSLDRGGEVDFRQPYFFTPEIALSLNAHGWYAEELAYRARSEGGRLGFDGRISTTATWSVAYTHEFTSTRVSAAALNDPTVRDTLIALGLNPLTGRQDGVLSAVSAAFQHNTTNNRLNPRTGYSVSLGTEYAGTWLPGDYNYFSVSNDTRGYLPVGESIVLAARVYVSSIDPVGSADDVPFFKRHFLGGSTSLRGWGRYEVAPLSASGLPLGGFSLFQTSLEARVLAWGSLAVVAFVDAGNVWESSWQFELGDLRYDAGPGLRYLTPVGPLRVDLAYQLNPLEGLLIDGAPQERRWRVHFSIGQSF